ncbi:MAG TPA: IS1182 family transposase, partial [Thermoanaerobaculia bacterium]|nr:IS1182 family transposase [Thermoanaerobaculia bacterium]
EPGQMLLLPPDLREWLEEGHLAYFILDVVAVLDLSEIYASYDGSRGGRPGFDPRLLVGLLVYGYCVGVTSSRKIEKATYESVPFRVLAANQHPDHATIAEFRRRHLEALARLFVQVLRLCEKAGLVRLGHVALDGTKMRANASKHKAMSYGRMEEKVRELEAQVADLLAAAEAADQAEDAQHGSRRGDEMPEELRFRQQRLEKIQQAKAALEAEAQAAAQRLREEKEAKGKAQESAPLVSPDPEEEETARPAEKAQRNFTDPDSRIMRDGATKSFEQSYNCQAAVDSQAQVIVAAQVTQQANDKQQVKPLVDQMKVNLEGRTPAELSADAGYYSDDNVAYLEGEKIEPYVATGRQKHTAQPGQPLEPLPAAATVRERMAAKLQTSTGKKVYSQRKETVEPVFGQIKEARGLRRFLLRGLGSVQAEWELICATHNLLKLFRSGWSPQMA